MGSNNTFKARDELTVDDVTYGIYKLSAVEGADRLPYSLKVMLENLLRNEDGQRITAEQVRALADWKPDAQPEQEIQYTPARVLMQDFTGVPAVVDLVAMRDAIGGLGGNPRQINPQIPTELVIDHSVIVDAFGQPNAFLTNATREFERNAERYQLLRWGQNAFNDFKVVPPDTGICHQVNLEYLARTVFTRDTEEGKLAYPDTLVGTDSHTPMVNGLGVLGWGVGGIEAEAAVLGQPISMLIPQVVGFKLTGELPAGTTATDLVLTVAELLRKTGVVGKFVEFFGPGVANVPLANRATIGNMSPEYGSTCSIFPIDEETLAYLRLTGRDEHQIHLVESYAKAQGMWHDPNHEAEYSEVVELDLGTVEPSIAGPKRPQDRIPLSNAHRTVEGLLTGQSHAEAVKSTEDTKHDWPSKPTTVHFEDGTEAEIDNGSVVIAAITSCTNTSNPSVMIAAALLAQKAVEKGLTRKPWVKTSLAPGSRVVTDYIESAGLMPYFEQLGFYLVGYGCTSCIGNSGPLIPEVGKAVDEGDLTVSSVLSGNRNFEGRIHPQCRMNFLSSPPLVVAYALAGSMHINLTKDPLGEDSDGNPVYLKDIWPSATEIEHTIAENLHADMFTKGYADVYTGDERWRGMEIAEGDTFEWQPDSTYVRRPTFFEDMPRQPQTLSDISDARVLAKLGDSVTTDHISPAGAIAPDSPAGKYLTEHGVERKDFNSYGSRRGNHEVMIRGTFANIRLRNLLAPGTEGGFTRDFTQTDGPVTTIFEASENYMAKDIPLVILAGKEYGSGSSRDWAAKGTILLGVKVVIAESYERIHRSNLIGMGVLPLEFLKGDSADSLGLTGEETFSISGLDGKTTDLPETVQVTATGDGDKTISFEAKVRIDTPAEAAYYQHGGILNYMLRELAGATKAA